MLIEMRRALAVVVLGVCMGCSRNRVQVPVAAVAPTLNQMKVVTVVTVELIGAEPTTVPLPAAGEVTTRQKVVKVVPEALSAPLLQTPVKLLDSAGAAHLEGKVVFHAIIAKDGSIEKLTMMQSTPGFGNAAVAAVQSWQYRPYLLNGEPVVAEATITVDFSLGN